MTEPRSLLGKTAVVTGCSTGIGKAIARSLALKGAQVCLVGRDAAALEDLRRDLSQSTTAQVYLADLRNFQVLNGVVDRIEADFGSIDILMNIAGLWHDNNRAYYGPKFDEIDNLEIIDVLNVGIMGTVLFTKSVVSKMKRRQRGKVVFISCGFAGPAEATGWVHYFVANKAIEAFTRGLAAECHEGIQINCVAPWFVATEAVLKFFPERAPTALQPDEVAEFAMFLASRQADHISGQVTVLRSKDDKELA